MTIRRMMFEQLGARRLLAGHTATDADVIVQETESNDRMREADVAEVRLEETLGLVGQVSSEDDRDWFRVTATSDGQLNLEIADEAVQRRPRWCGRRSTA